MADPTPAAPAAKPKPRKPATARAKPATPPAAKAKPRAPAKTPTATQRAGKAVRGAIDSLPEGTGKMVGAAAAGLVAGLAASVGRKIATQAISTGMATEWDQALANEHKAAIAIFDAIQATTPSQTGKRSTLLLQLKHALGKHAVEEENVIYCALRDQDDAKHADELNHDHGYVKQYLYDLEQMPRHEPGWIAKIVEFRAAIEKHVRKEEDAIFPALKARLSDEQNSRLSLAMHKEGLAVA